MPKIKAKKVLTPGSKLQAKVGRPKKHVMSRIDKTRGKYMLSYSKESLTEAMELIETKQMSLREASKKYKIPKAVVGIFIFLISLQNSWAL